MTNEIVLKAIEKDIDTLDPIASQRIVKARETRQKWERKNRSKYNSRYYLKNREKQKEYYRNSYQPVIQSPTEHDDIDYDVF